MSTRISDRIHSIVDRVGSTRAAAEYLGVSQRTVQRAEKAYREGRDFVRDTGRKSFYKEAIPAARDKVKANASLDKLIEKKYPKESGLDKKDIERIKREVIEGKRKPQDIVKSVKEQLKAFKQQGEKVKRGVLIYQDYQRFIDAFGGTEPYVAGRFSSQKEAVDWTKSFGAGPQYFVVVKIMVPGEDEPEWDVYDVRGPNYHHMDGGDKDALAGQVMDIKNDLGYEPEED